MKEWNLNSIGIGVCTQNEVSYSNWLHKDDGARGKTKRMKFQFKARFDPRVQPKNDCE